MAPSEPDYVADTMNLLLGSGHRIAITPIDYDFACQWQQQGIPWSIVERVLEDKIKRSQGKGWLPKLRLDWLDAEIQDEYRNWARAVGHR